MVVAGVDSPAVEEAVEASAAVEEVLAVSEAGALEAAVQVEAGNVFSF